MRLLSSSCVFAAALLCLVAPSRSATLPEQGPAARSPDPAGALDAGPQTGQAGVEGALQRMARAAAVAHALPASYFIRLIARESRFDSHAVSPAGAMGISQFMPGTAAARGLVDPFDPAQALPKSAEYLSDLRSEFGNLGLAAAAYNAGPARVHRWLAGESRLPGETLRYVRAVTGRDAESWAPAGVSLLRGAAEGESVGEGTVVPFGKNWELALLLSMSAPSRTPAGLAPLVNKPRPTRKGGRFRQGPPKPISAASLEQQLCSSCIVRQAY